MKTKSQPRVYIFGLLEGRIPAAPALKPPQSFLGLDRKSGRPLGQEVRVESRGMSRFLLSSGTGRVTSVWQKNNFKDNVYDERSAFGV